MLQTRRLEIGDKKKKKEWGMKRPYCKRWNSRSKDGTGCCSQQNQTPCRPHIVSSQRGLCRSRPTKKAPRKKERSFQCCKARALSKAKRKNCQRFSPQEDSRYIPYKISGIAEKSGEKTVGKRENSTVSGTVSTYTRAERDEEEC